MADTLAQKVRARYPGDYDDLSDQELEIAVQRKFPGVYNDIPKTPYKTAKTEDFLDKPEGSAAGRFLSNAGAVVNPISIAKGLYDTLMNPIDTAKGIVAASGEQLGKAKQAFGEGRYVEAAGHTLGATPIIGPAAAAAGEQIATGDIAGGLGTGAGLLVGTVAPGAVLRHGGKVIPKSAAPSLRAGAAERVVDVMAPKVGPNKLRYGRMADKVAPELLKRGDIKGFSREALQEHIGQRLVQAEEGLDEAANLRLSGKTFPVQPLIAELKAKRGQLTAKAVGEGSDVVPSPNNARVAVIDQAIAELQQLGPVTKYDPIKLIRQAYDGPAKAIYSPSMTADFLKAQGGKMGAADVTGVLRDNLAKWDPGTAAANAEYSLYRTAHDVLEATAEIERVRPKVGRALVARMIFSGIGMKTGGPAGAATGFMLGPMLEAAVGSGPTVKLQTAKLMTKLASAIRRGDEGHVASLVSQVKAQQPVTDAGKMLPEGARQMPGVPDPSFVRGVPAQPALSGRPRQLPEGQAPPRVFNMPGEVQPDPSRVGSVQAQPLAYTIDPHVTVKAGGVRVAQFAGDPDAARAAIATPEVRDMLRRMAADLDIFEPVRGRVVTPPVNARFDRTTKSNLPGGAEYVPGAAGSPVGDDIRVISDQHVGNGEIKKAIQDMLKGKMPTNRLHTAALDAAMGYLEGRSGYRGPSVPLDWVDAPAAVDDGFEAFSKAVDDLARRKD